MQFRIDSNEMLRRPTWTEPDRLLKARRHFASTTIGKDWVCFGGFIKNGMITDEMISFDLETMKWQTVQFTEHSEQPSPTVYGALCAVALQN